MFLPAVLIAAGTAIVMPISAETMTRLEGCPLNGDLGLPASFQYIRKGRIRSAEAAVALPASFETVAGLIGAVERYPDWLWIDDRGNRSLRSVVFDPAMERVSISVGEDDEARIEGRLSRRVTPTSLELKFETRGAEGFKETALDVLVAPYTACEGTAALTIRSTWKVGFLANLFADEVSLALPVLATLAFRDDLIAHVVSSRDDLRNQLRDRWSGFEMLQVSAEGQVSNQIDSKLRFKPGVVRGLSEAGEKLRAYAASNRPSPAKLLDACLPALSGMTRIVDYSAALRIEDGGALRWIPPMELRPGDVRYVLQVQLEGVSFACDAPK